MSSKVFFTSMKTNRGESLLTKLEKLVVRAGLLDAFDPIDPTFLWRINWLGK